MNPNELKEAINALKNSEHWQTIETLRDELLERLNEGLNSSIREIPLVCEPNLGTIVMSRMAEMGGIKRYFDLIEAYNQMYLNELKDKKLEAMNGKQ